MKTSISQRSKWRAICRPDSPLNTSPMAIDAWTYEELLERMNKWQFEHMISLEGVNGDFNNPPYSKKLKQPELIWEIKRLD